MKNNSQNQVYLLLFLALVVNMTGLFCDVFMVDPALYANIAKQMVLRNNFLELYSLGTDWLDKPHFPFWVSALSFKIFGINGFAFKLPAILFSFMGVFYTYRLAREFYDRQTALLSALILATALHLILSNNDVRAEPYLTGLVIASSYHFYRLTVETRWRDIVLGSLLAAFAVMTKGYFTLIPVVAAITGHLAVQRRLRDLLHWKWLLSFFLLAVFILPEIYALWYQFDSQPEKIVFGEPGRSGIGFFLWESQLGRFFNTGPIRGSGDISFFLHTLIWAFLPWSVMMYYGLGRFFRDLVSPRFSLKEGLSLFGFLLPFLVFSFSKFQLPHYTNIIFPFLAIITAVTIQSGMSVRLFRFFRWSQYGIMALIFLMVLIISWLFKPGAYPPLAIILIGLVIFLFWISGRVVKDELMKIIARSSLAIIFLGLFLNLVFYPKLLVYQTGRNVAEYIHGTWPDRKVWLHEQFAYPFEFYLENPLVRCNTVELAEAAAATSSNVEDDQLLVFTNEYNLDRLREAGIPFRIIRSFKHYHITRLNLTFLNHKTRNQQTYLRHVLLVGN